jgi:TetR/AcrR family transcriptional regulator, regulator of cefoperazone and chloramphenicol sensitivity
MRTPRIDGEESRQRLLHAAVNCFAAHGFAKTSTRMIATEADTNIAAISYYFGDKAGLYRAAFTEPIGSPQDDIALFNDPSLSLDDALHGLYSGFIAPLKENAHVQQCIRLHMREMVEPTGLWEEQISQGCKPHQDALVKLLVRHYGVKKPDDDITRLAISIVAQGVYMFVGRDLALQLYPHLVSGTKALDVMQERLVMYARAMVDAEGARRLNGAAKAPATKPIPRPTLRPRPNSKLKK